MAVASHVSFKTADVQRVVDWLVQTPLPYKDTHELITILINGLPFNPDVVFQQREPGHDPEGMT